MDWEYNIFILTIQPDLTKTITNSIPFYYNISLNEELSAGILLMADNIWKDDYINHLKLQLSTYDQKIILYTPSDYKKIYQISENNLILPFDKKTSWYRYINILSSDPNNIIRVPSEINMPYTCRFFNPHNKTSNIHQFESSSFIRGSISVCHWFSLNPYNYIDNIHKGNSEVKIV